MDDKEFDKRADKLEQIGKVLEKLPVEMRKEAFDLLKSYVAEDSGDKREKKLDQTEDTEADGGSEEDFFAAFNHDKPADNARMIAAWFYREYGVEPFSLDEVHTKATDVGLTIPVRVDMTFLNAMDKGKKLFARAGFGKFKPTVHGEASLKAAYSVKKGKKKRAGDIE